MSKRLYRYIGFEDFVNLFINNKERFVSPVRWDDKNEGFLFSHFENQDDMHNIVSEMYYHLSDKIIKQLLIITLECGIVNGLYVHNVGQNIRKQMQCGDVILTKIGH